MAEKHRVFLGRCDSYGDPPQIAAVIARGMAAVGAAPPAGRVVIKPNLVLAHPVHARHCYTRPEFMEALLSVVYGEPSGHVAGRDGGSGSPSGGGGMGAAAGDRAVTDGKAVTSVAIVEKCGVGAPTTMAFRRAGYRRLTHRFPVRLVAMEEARKKQVQLTRGKIHSRLTLAKDVADSDYLLFAPKLKSNVLAHGMTAALKLNVGSLDDPERMHHHDFNLDEKIVDILEAANPRLIVTDAIEIAVGGNQMTENGRPLGLVMVADNPLAHDLVAARVLNLDPGGIGHLQAAIRRGYTPASLNEVEVVGDFPLAEIQARTASYDLGFQRVDRFPSPFRIVCGEPYCTGGCHGVFLDWLYMIKDRQPHKITRFPQLTVVIGRAAEPVEGESVLLVGKCAAQSTVVGARRVVRLGRGKCPPTHRDIILWMALNYLIFAPLLRPETVVDAYVIYPFRRLLGRLAGVERLPRAGVGAATGTGRPGSGAKSVGAP